jgi:Na+-driven multidrug efflux pump
MSIRIAVMFGLAVLFTKTGWLSDGRRGALIFMVGMIVEAISALWSFRKWFHALPERAAARGQMAAGSSQESPLTTHRVWTFYLPLVLAALTGALAPSILSAGLARMHDPRMVIATFAQASVVTTLVLGTLFLVHQVSLFYAVPPGAAGARARNRRVHRFCLQVGLGAAAVLGVLAWTPAGDWLLLKCFQATPTLLADVKRVLHLSMYLPLVLVWNEYRVGLLLAAGHSRVLTITKLCSVATLATVVFALARLFPDLGAVAAPISSFCALSVEQTVLLLMTQRLKHG